MAALYWDRLAELAVLPPWEDLSLGFFEFKLLLMTLSDRMDCFRRSALLVDALLARLTWPAEPEPTPDVSIVFASSRALTLARSLNWLLLAEEDAAAFWRFDCWADEFVSPFILLDPPTGGRGDVTLPLSDWAACELYCADWRARCLLADLIVPPEVDLV